MYQRQGSSGMTSHPFDITTSFIPLVVALKGQEVHHLNTDKKDTETGCSARGAAFSAPLLH